MDWRSVRFDWNRARAFLVTAEEGSFSAAARALATTQPTIGRQVAALEEELGITLFERVGRGLRLTESALELVEHVRAMGEAATQVSLVAAGQAGSLEGPVTITASEIISAHYLMPAVAAIREAHPSITVEVVASVEAQDLRRREADIAVRNFRPDDGELIGRWIRDAEAYLYATPGYLERLGAPASPEGLARADFIGFDRGERMAQAIQSLGVPVAAERFVLVSRNQQVQWAMAKAGLGVCLMMAEVGDDEPSVVRALADLSPLPVPLWLVTHREVRTSKRVRAVFELLAQHLRSPEGPGAVAGD